MLDLTNGRVNTLDNDARVYSRLTWNDDGTALAVLKGVDVDKMRERDNMLIAFPNVQAALGDVEAAPVEARSGEGRRLSRRAGCVSDRAALDWSDDNKRVFFGAKEQVPAPDTGAPQAAPTKRPTSTSGTPTTSASSRCR